MIKALETAKKKFEKLQTSAGFNPRSGEKLLEREVKKAVKEIVLEMAPYDSQIFMPVQTGFGSTDLDFIIALFGRYLTIETKVSGKKPTPRQIKTMSDKIKAGAVGLYIDQNNLEDLVFVVDLLSKELYDSAMRAAEVNRERYLER